jgi:hypothetical protein
MAFKERWTNEDFIKKAIEIHGDIYDYSKVEYKNQKTPVIIICKKHGEFTKIPLTHISQKQGCPYCSAERLGRKYKPPETKELDRLEELAKKIEERKNENPDYDTFADSEVIDNIVEDVAKNCAEEIIKITNKVKENTGDGIIQKRKIKEYLMKRMIKFFPDYRSNGSMYDFLLIDKDLLLNIDGKANILNVKDFDSLKRIF